MPDGYLLDEQTALDVIQLVRLYRRNGWFDGNAPKPPRSIASPQTPAYVHNDSGETIPAYACMQATGTIEIGSQNFFLVDKPSDTDGSAGGFLFNGPHAIADNEEGVAQLGSRVRAFKNTGTVTAGDAWVPVVNQWYIAAGTGPFVAIGADDVDTNVLWVFTGIAGGDIKHFAAPVGGIPARSGSTLGSATCTLLTIAGGTRATTSATYTVYNNFTTAVGASHDIAAAKINGIWSVIAEDC